MARRKRKLKKSKKDKLISGVVGGVAEYYQVDATLLRIGWVVLVSFTGFVPGVVAYAAASLIMPD